MANRVNRTPPLPLPFNLNSFSGIADFLTQFVNSISSEFQAHALRLNIALVSDGTETPSAPVIYKPYLKAALPDVSKFINGIIIVTDDVGGRVPAFSDGTNWRRVTDRNIIS